MNVNQMADITMNVDVMDLDTDEQYDIIFKVRPEQTLYTILKGVKSRHGFCVFHPYLDGDFISDGNVPCSVLATGNLLIKGRHSD
jgi:hypothetical protein